LLTCQRKPPAETHRELFNTLENFPARLSADLGRCSTVVIFEFSHVICH
jgi:hypothetical protein